VYVNLSQIILAFDGNMAIDRNLISSFRQP